MKKLIPIFIICSILGSCSMHMEKRRYFKGYYISFSPHRGQNNKTEKKTDLQRSIQLTRSTPELTASVQIQNLEVPKTNLTSSKQDQVSSKHNKTDQSAIVTSDKNHTLKIKNINNSQKQYYLNNSDTQPGISQSKSKKSASDGLFLLFSGAFVAAFTMAFKPFISHTKKIGYWALNNRKLARGLHFVAHCSLATSGLYLGHRIYDAGLVSSDVTSYSLAGAATVLTALYPHRKVKKGLFKNTYFKQKMFSLFMALTGLLMCINIGNRNADGNLSFPLVKSVFNIGTYSNSIVADSIQPEKIETPKDDHKGGKIVLTVLTSIVSFLLLIVIVAGSCSLSCSGQESLAAGTMVLGLPLLAVLTVFIIRNIWKTDKKNQNNEGVAPQ